MPSINNVQIMGYLGQDPEIRYTNNGTACASLSVATSKKWKDKQTGEMKENTEWHRISLFGRQAEIAGEYLRKGNLVLIQGELRTRKWQDQQGNDRYTTEVVATPFGGLTLMPQGGGAPTSGGGNQPRQQQGQSGGGDEPAGQETFDDDIPF